MFKKYKLEIYEAPLKAIKNGLKKVEIRTNNSYEEINYDELVSGDILSFQIIAGPPFTGLEVITPDALEVEVMKVIKYKDPQELLEKEGFDVLSTLVETIEEGVDLLYSFHEYKEMIPVHGIFAIHITSIN
jgi:ASC-1-like (ASCH) protein